jgi:amino acid adenylation domain-containing protein
MEYLLQHAFERVAREHPVREAFRAGSVSVSYREAEERANQLARFLQDRGVQRGDRVALLLDRSCEACIAIFAILKAGAVYLPIDPQAPAARVEQLCELGRIAAVVMDAKSRRKFESIAPPESLRAVFEFGEDDLADCDSAPLPTDAIESDLAYIIFTSGSTGTPKGIMHTHHSAISYARWAAAEYGLRPEDRVANFSPFHFDISTFDLFAAREVGAQTTIVPQGVQMFPASCSQLLEKEAISIVFTVPYLLMQLEKKGCLADRDLSAIRWLIYGGEPYPPTMLVDLMRAIPSTKVSNMYGPAEVNGVTCHHLSEPPATNDPIPIGRPSRNTEMLVLDADNEPVKPGEPGELLVRSPTRMEGYWNRPMDTQEAVYKRVRPGLRPEVFHRTGDLVKQCPKTGEYIFLERLDHLVKTRGYRVELGEIEARLLECEGVEAAAAYAVRVDETAQIHAVIVSRELVDAVVEAALRSSLPNYALPLSIRNLDALPRTSTGKVDRTHLRDTHPES